MSGFGPGLGWGSKQRGIKLTATFLGAVLIPGRDTPVWVGHFPGRGGRKRTVRGRKELLFRLVFPRYHDSMILSNCLDCLDG